MSPDFSANYMSRKRSADLAMAGSVKFSVAQWIALGKVPDCSEENKAKAARAKLWLENRVESVIASKPKLIWNNTIQEFVPPTPGDIPQGATEIPEENLYVVDKPKDGNSGSWKKVPDMRNVLREQFAKHKFEDY